MQSVALQPKIGYRGERVLSQDIKGARWMPWQAQAMKDVVSSDMPRGGASNLRSGDFRMGKPSPLGLLPAEHIGRVERTGRIETSQ